MMWLARTTLGHTLLVYACLLKGTLSYITTAVVTGRSNGQYLTSECMPGWTKLGRPLASTSDVEQEEGCFKVFSRQPWEKAFSTCEKNQATMFGASTSDMQRVLVVLKESKSHIPIWIWLSKRKRNQCAAMSSRSQVETMYKCNVHLAFVCWVATRDSMCSDTTTSTLEPQCPSVTSEGTRCPNGWTAVGDKCYYYFHESLSHSKASERCKEFGSLPNPEEAVSALEHLGIKDTDVWVAATSVFKCYLARAPSDWCNNKYPFLCSTDCGSNAIINQMLIDGQNVRTAYPAENNSALDICCQTQGIPMPKAEITWKTASYSGYLPHFATARIRPKCEDSGQILTCLARNKFGVAEPRKIQIMVKCPLAIISFSLTEEYDTLLKQTTLHFQCRASGYPAPALKLFKQDTGTTLLTTVEQNLLEYDFQGWACEDTAIYVCQILDEGNHNESDSIRSLRVGNKRCAPVLCTNQSQTQNIYARRGDAIDFHVCVKLYDDLYEHYKINDVYSYGTKFKISASKLDELRFKIEIKIADVGPTDYGLVNVTISSKSYNKLFYVFHLLDPGPALCSNQSQDEVVIADLGDTILTQVCVADAGNCKFDVRINDVVIRTSNPKYIIFRNEMEPLQCNITIQVTNITAADFGLTNITLVTAVKELHSTFYLRERGVPTSSAPEAFRKPQSDDDAVLAIVVAVVVCAFIIVIVVAVVVVYMYKKKELRLRRAHGKRVRDEPDGQYANMGALTTDSAAVTGDPSGGQGSQPDSSSRMSPHGAQGSNGGAGGSGGCGAAADGGNGAAGNSNEDSKRNQNNEGLVYATVAHTGKNVKKKPKRAKQVDEEHSPVEYVNLVDLSNEKTTEEKKKEELTYISIAHAARASTLKREPSRVEERVEYAPLNFAKMEELSSTAGGQSQEGEEFSNENTREQEERGLTYATIAQTAKSGAVKKPKRGNSYTEERVEYVTLDFAKMEEVSNTGGGRQDGGEEEEVKEGREI